jgi:hypothetical protein
MGWYLTLTPNTDGNPNCLLGQNGPSQAGGSWVYDPRWTGRLWGKAWRSGVCVTPPKVLIRSGQPVSNVLSLATCPSSVRTREWARSKKFEAYLRWNALFCIVQQTHVQENSQRRRTNIEPYSPFPPNVPTSLDLHLVNEPPKLKAFVLQP